MKRLFLLFTFLIVAFVQPIGAQSNKLGFKGGGNFANFRGEDADNAKMKTGFHFGGFFTAAFGNVALQPEFLISTRGAIWNEAALETYSNLLYLDVPIVLKLYITENFNLHFGPQVGFLLSASHKKDPEPEDYDEDASEQYETLDYGAVGGLEFESDIGIFLGARYYHGLSRIGEDYESSIVINNSVIKTNQEAKDIKNSMIQLYVGVGF